MIKEHTTEPNLTTVINSQIVERLRHPLIRNLYEAYYSKAILFNLVGILQRIPEDQQGPILHTLSTHVTKEKPLFIYAVGESFGVPKNRFQTMAAAVDLLWTLALMVDDIEDKDQQRAGMDSAWIIYGAEKAYQSAEAGFQAVIETLVEVFDPGAARLCKSYVEKGVASLGEHRALTLEATDEELIANYIKRADFHTTAPVEILWRFSDKKGNKETAIAAMREVNLAGQILNDIKDFLPEYSWLREGFSDVRSGLVTLPINRLWSLLNQEKRRGFSSIFGKRELETEEIDFLRACIEETGVMGLLKGEIAGLYTSSLGNYNQVIGPEEARGWFQTWLDYKLEQLSQVPK